MASPERTCVGCRVKAPKANLLRVVRPAGGGVAVDPSGSAPGRGAYVHVDAGCMKAAVRHGAFPGALRTGLTAETAARLEDDLQRLIGDE
jgi:uncharacterized protein